MMYPAVERYIEVALAGVRRSERDDVRVELHTAIDDEVHELMLSGVREDEAVESVLNEFGDPLQFVAQYRARPLGLVSPERYPAWRSLVRLLLLIAVPGTFAVFLVVGVERGEAVLGIIGGAAFAALEACVHVCFWTMLGFALADRLSPPATAAEHEVPWSTAYLPQMPAGATRVTNGEVLIWSGLALVGAAFIAFQGLVTSVWSSSGIVPVLAPGEWDFWWPFLIAVLLLIAAVPIVARVRGTWSKPRLAVRFLLEAALVVPVGWLVLSGRALNADFIDLVDRHAAPLGWSLRTSPVDLVSVALLAVLAIALTWSAIDSVRSARQLDEQRLSHRTPRRES